MPIDRKQLRDMVHDVLMYLDPHIPFSDAAKELVLLTIATESLGGTYVRQVRGPARGIVQMEPSTESYLWTWIDTQPRELQDKMTRLYGSHQLFMREGSKDAIELPPMQYNLAYQIAMCRVFYWRVREPLPEVKFVDWEDPKGGPPQRRPDKESIERLGKYWKKWYNSPLGKGVPEEAVKNYFRYAC